MRGEHSEMPATFVESVGSSPHARGARSLLPLLAYSSRIIPACAGSTRRHRSRRARRGDHPRMRGEHLDRMFVFPLTEGSSPHARGALPEQCLSDQRGGIIPACAGSTLI